MEQLEKDIRNWMGVWGHSLKKARQIVRKNLREAEDKEEATRARAELKIIEKMIEAN